MRTASQKKRDEAKERSDYGSHLHTWLDSEFERSMWLTICKNIAVSGIPLRQLFLRRNLRLNKETNEDELATSLDISWFLWFAKKIMNY